MATIEERPSAHARLGAPSHVAYERVREWELLYHRHRKQVLALCRRMSGDPALSEDLTQETFIRILQRPPRYLAENSWPWVARVAHNICVDELRARGRSVVPLADALSADDDDTLPAIATDADATFHEVESLELHRRLRAALSTLSPRQRRVVLLRLVAGWSCEDVARAEGTKVKTVKNLTWRARSLLRDAWSAEGVRPLGWIAAAVVSVRLALTRARARFDDVMTASFTGGGGLVSDRIAAAMMWAGAAVATLVIGFATPSMAQPPTALASGTTTSSSNGIVRSAGSDARAGIATSLTVSSGRLGSRGTYSAAPNRPGRPLPPQGTITIQVAAPNGQEIASNSLSWDCPQRQPNFMVPQSPAKIDC